MQPGNRRRPDAGENHPPRSQVECDSEREPVHVRQGPAAADTDRRAHAAFLVHEGAHGRGNPAVYRRDIAAGMPISRGIRTEVAQPMGWERGYYYRVRKVNGRVVRKYVGRGAAAELAAALDGLEREQRRRVATEQRREADSLAALDAALRAVAAATDRAVRATLLAAGYRRHHRSEWRRCREPTAPDT
jgi:hypothetical protein